MHALLPLIRGLLGIVLGTMLAGMVAAQVWVFTTRPELERHLPRAVPRVSRWGLGPVLIVCLGSVLLQNLIAFVYLASRPVLVADLAPNRPRVPPSPAKPLALDPSRAAVLAAEAPPPPPLSFTERIALGSAANLLILVLAPATLALTSRTRLRDLGFTLDEFWPDVGRGIVAFGLVTPWVYCVNLLALEVFRPNAHPLQEMLEKGAPASVVALAFVSAVVLAPVAEEMLFRGVLLQWMNRVSAHRRFSAIEPEPGPPTMVPAAPDDGRGEAITATEPEPLKLDPGFEPDEDQRPTSELRPVIASSVLFAILHGEQMPAPLPLFVLSIALGLLAQRTGRLTASITLHALFNLFATAAIVFALLD